MPRFQEGVYTKQNFGVNATVATGAKATHILVDIAQPRQLKNIRGVVIIGDNVVSPNTSVGGGYIFLMKWPEGEAVPSGAIDLQDPRVLHPVAYAYQEYPHTLFYEFRGVNLSQHTSLHFGIQNANGGTTHKYNLQFLFAMRVHPPTG